VNPLRARLQRVRAHPQKSIRPMRRCNFSN